MHIIRFEVDYDAFGSTMPIIITAGSLRCKTNCQKSKRKRKSSLFFFYSGCDDWGKMYASLWTTTRNGLQKRIPNDVRR